jgi:TPR repeat protein
MDVPPFSQEQKCPRAIAPGELLFADWRGRHSGLRFVQCATGGSIRTRRSVTRSTAAISGPRAYYNGDGVQSNDVVSGAWFLLAEDSGSDAAKDAVARIMNDMSLGQVLASFEKVAVMFRKGDEVPHSDAEAAKWYRKAADKGDASASVELAQQLVKGLGVQQDYPEARRRCGDAAKAGFGPGAYCLALMDREGLGGPKDFEQAAKWFGEAANLQDARALLFLGDMYSKGEGVKQNKEIAYMWYWIAANSEIKEAAQSEERLKQEMDKKTVERAQRKAMEWSGKHQQMMLRRRPNS